MNMMKTTEVTLNQGTPEERQVKVELNLNLKKMMVISRDYPEANDIATLTVSEKGMQLDMVQLAKIVYLAYRQANMYDYLTFDEFQDAYEFDMEQATRIWFSMINKEYRLQYLEEINKAKPNVSSKA